MNVQVLWNGNDITTSVVEYAREQDICNGTGTLDISVEAKTARNFKPWDTITIYENGDKMHVYNIASEEETVPGILYSISCQDDSKRLSDFFIDNIYVIDYPSTARYWIEKFLTDAGVSYNFNVSGSGNSLSENTQLGATSAYDAIINLLQLSGWYFYFDNNNVCQIGKLSIDGSNPARTFYGDEILEIGYIKQDKMLRNRAVVWGGGDPETHSWIWADTSTMTPWNRPNGDYRTVVYSNTAIKTFSIAYSLAFLLLSEFSRTIPEKKLMVPSSYSEIELGSFVRGVSNFITVEGAVTHLSINVNSEGFTSTYTLDQRCPRLFGYANWNDYVYIGTRGNGVWRKYILGSTWNNYSTGITDLNIKDLSASDGLLGAISTTISGVEDANPEIDSQLYVRHTSLGSWRAYNPGSFMDYSASGGAIELSSGIIAEACSIDKTYGVNGLVTVAYTIPGSGMFVGSGEYYAPSGNLSWVQGVTVDRVPIYTQQICAMSGVANLGFDMAVIDMDTNWDGHNIISVHNGRVQYGPIIPPASGTPYDYGGPAYSVGATALGAVPAGNGNNWAVGNIEVVVPEPIPSGYWDLTAPMYSFGGCIVEDNLETDGIIYGCSRSFVTKVQFCLASAVWNGTGWEDYYQIWQYPLDNPIPIFDTARTFFHRKDDSNFTLIKLKDYTDWTAYHIEIQGASGIVTTTDLTIPSANYMPTKPFFSDYIANQGEKYLGVMYSTSQTANDRTYWLGVLNTHTGSWASNISLISTDDVGYLDSVAVLTDVDSSPNWSYFGWVYCHPVQGGNGGAWRGITLYYALMNKKTGGVTMGSQLIYVGEGDAYIRYGAGGWDDWVSDYRDWSFCPAYENPETGVGFGHFYVSVFCEHVSTALVNVYIVDATINTAGGITYKRYEDIWKYDSGYGGYIRIVETSPSWTKSTVTNNLHSHVRPFYSRYVVSPVVMKADNAVDDVFVSPYDFDAIIGTVQTIPYPNQWGLSFEYDSIKHYYQMADDIDDSFYVGLENTTWGLEITAGYNFDGSVKKIVMDGDVYGQPLDSKIYSSSDSDGYVTTTIHAFMPKAPIPSGRSRLASRYLLLDHNPKVEPSGLFSIIYQSTNPMLVDTSKGIPTVVYQQPTTAGANSPFLSRSFTNERGSFAVISPNAPVYDVRTFDLSGSIWITPPSGNIPSGFLNRYVGVAGGELGLLMYNSEFENNDYTVLKEGNFTHLDFTNTFASPYMFVSTSGGGLVASGRFLQKDSESFGWSDYSATLPSGIITIIRADDRM